MEEGAAWGEFCEIYEPLIYRIARKFGLQDADAREIGQEVLLKVCSRIHDFDPSKDGRFSSWLGVLARNASIDLLRKSRRRQVGGSSIQAIFGELTEPAVDECEFDLELRRQQFRWATKQVSHTVNAKTWEAFWQTAVLGQSGVSVARRLGMSVGAVYVARCRVVAKIKAALDETRGAER